MCRVEKRLATYDLRLRSHGRSATIHPLDELRGRGLNDHHADDTLMLVHQLLGGIPCLFHGGVITGNGW